jgi:hypothetical protein
MRNSRLSLAATLAAMTALLLSLFTSSARASSSGSAPVSVAAVATGANEITVRWTQPPRAVVSGYEVQMVEGGNQVAVMTAASNSFPFKGLSAGRWYSFKVRAVINGKKGPYSSTSTPVYLLRQGEATAPVTVPRTENAPSALSVSVIDRTASLSWGAPYLASGQRVANYIVTAVPGPIVLTVSGSSFSAGFADLKADTTYTFSVQTVLTNGRRSPAISSLPVFIGTVTTTAPTTTTTTTTTTIAPTTTTTTLQPLPSVPALAAIPVAKCISQVWPASTLGRPQSFGAGAKRGVYVWFESGTWNVHAYNPSGSPVLFTGSVSTGSTHKIYPTFVEGATDLVKAGSKSSSFSLSATNDIDAFRIASPCSRSITFSFLVNGQPIPTEEVFVGASGAHPLSSKFVLTR